MKGKHNHLKSAASQALLLPAVSLQGDSVDSAGSQARFKSPYQFSSGRGGSEKVQGWLLRARQARTKEQKLTGPQKVSKALLPSKEDKTDSLFALSAHRLQEPRQLQ